MLRIAGTVNDSIVDGPGLRFSIFAQGCPHKCRGCHNPQTHDFNGGNEISTAELISRIKANPLLSGVTLTGGEPFAQALAFAELAQEVKRLQLNVITYTGYIFEDLLAVPEYLSLLKFTDFLIDGPFDETKKSLGLNFRGSSNQRIIDVQESIRTGCTVEGLF